jgi:Arc/MetJ-type ribon-helix-helix transcriptional regulator
MADDTEKVSINVSAMDLANIDLLVEKTLYKDRTDFFRTAIRNQADKHSYIIESAMKGFEEEKTRSKKFALWVGPHVIDKEEFFELVEFSGTVAKIENKEDLKIKLVVFGSLTIIDEISLEDLKNNIISIKVFGIFRASSEIKKYYK